MMVSLCSSLVWLRRDLRLHDHASLASALAAPGNIQPLFILDTDILARFQNKEDRRLSFIMDTLCRMDNELRQRDGGLLVLHGRAEEIIPKLAETLGAGAVYAGEDYEPETRKRDSTVKKSLDNGAISLHLQKEHVLIAPPLLLKDDGTPYRVFTPYSRAWAGKLTPADFREHKVEDRGRYGDFAAVARRAKTSGLTVIPVEKGPEAALSAIGYHHLQLPLWPAEDGPARLHAFCEGKISRYKEQRDYMGKDGTSALSPYIRFGQVSIRECYRLAKDAPSSGTWINELIWRDFYAAILYHFPYSAKMELQPAYQGRIPWSDNPEHWERYIAGNTGFPIVDAAIRQITTTGWMHNRARMIVASFLTKDLHIDWRKGEEHFAQLLMDYDLASNVGGWQWAASTGTDAQPYFRIFNPFLQGKRFDPDGSYIRHYVPELAKAPDEFIHEPEKFKVKRGVKLDYPSPMVDHALEREKAIAMFKL